MITQRAVISADAGEVQPILWQAGIPDANPGPEDVYLVVEEQDDSLFVVLATRWPSLDGLGRLTFSDEEPVVVTIAEADLEAQLVRAWGARDPRPIRVGDAFLVRGLPTETTDALADALEHRPVSEWGAFVDVSRAAREAAKAALYAAAAPRVSESHARALGLEQAVQPLDEPPEGMSTAEPTV
jgi:hypothetical protein